MCTTMKPRPIKDFCATDDGESQAYPMNRGFTGIEGVNRSTSPPQTAGEVVRFTADFLISSMVSPEAANRGATRLPRL
jgi:hypothetical protein